MLIWFLSCFGALRVNRMTNFTLLANNITGTGSSFANITLEFTSFSHCKQNKGFTYINSRGDKLHFCEYFSRQSVDISGMGIMAQSKLS